tara:strand:+ start:269 stop:592 length:324 start_codon:yes stop_codon:yes gene_type:complete
MTTTTGIVTIDEEVWSKLTGLLTKIVSGDQKTYKPAHKYLIAIRETYDLTFKNIIKDYFTYLIKHKKIQVTSAFLAFVERVVHSSSINDDILINYVLGGFGDFSTIL